MGSLDWSHNLLKKELQIAHFLSSYILFQCGRKVAFRASWGCCFAVRNWQTPCWDYRTDIKLFGCIIRPSECGHKDSWNCYKLAARYAKWHMHTVLSLYCGPPGFGILLKPSTVRCPGGIWRDISLMLFLKQRQSAKREWTSSQRNTDSLESLPFAEVTQTDFRVQITLGPWELAKGHPLLPIFPIPQSYLDYFYIVAWGRCSVDWVVLSLPPHIR